MKKLQKLTKLQAWAKHCAAKERAYSSEKEEYWSVGQDNSPVPLDIQSILDQRGYLTGSGPATYSEVWHYLRRYGRDSHYHRRREVKK